MVLSYCCGGSFNFLPPDGILFPCRWMGPLCASRRKSFSPEAAFSPHLASRSKNMGRARSFDLVTDIASGLVCGRFSPDLTDDAVGVGDTVRLYVKNGVF